ncbi:hypothetical protein CSC62_15645 [Pseudoxanthomonas jiangsuensis]|uniref:hypothetical protein n=1 Tax=Pseudoxanthomonas jiangsuensis TaxID=619688 RepID=UPI0013917AEB|nr:hypothetical protein [Pseudoxanthomonas jiangsuensis]KAF1691623.1 hypothetical protein CSC62_15645 [Pseudoxanthomonas jiangsuensis]
MSAPVSPAPRPGVALEIARAWSLLLHPFAVFVVLALVAAWRLSPQAMARAGLGMAVGGAGGWGFVWRRWRSGRWSTVDASRPQERPWLYALSLGLAGGYWLWLGGRASPLSAGVLAVVGMLCVAGLANRWIKLSLHMASLAFVALLSLWLYRPLGIALLLALPLLAWSRLRLGRHSPAEVAGGALLGAAFAAVTLL